MRVANFKPMLTHHWQLVIQYCVPWTLLGVVDTCQVVFLHDPRAYNSGFYQIYQIYHCNVDTSLAVSDPVLCTLDCIESLGVVDTCQVVFLHDPRGYNSGFYQIYQNNAHIVCLDTYLDKNLGPFQVIDRRIVSVMFCSHTLGYDLSSNLTPKQALDDYRKDIWSHDNHNTSYTQYLETIIDKLCVFMDLDSLRVDFHSSDASNDATDVTYIPNSITALLGVDTNTTLQVSYDTYIPSKTVGFLSHKDTVFEFIGPDRLPVSIDSVDKCIEIVNIIRTTGLPNYKSPRH